MPREIIRFCALAIDLLLQSDETVINLNIVKEVVLMEISSNPSSGKSAWVQLYEARQLMGNIESRPPGRPPSSVPRRKVGLTLSQGEIQELECGKKGYQA